MKNMERPWTEVEREREAFGCLRTPADRCCLYERQASTLHILSLALFLCVCVCIFVIQHSVNTSVHSWTTQPSSGLAIVGTCSTFTLRNHRESSGLTWFGAYYNPVISALWHIHLPHHCLHIGSAWKTAQATI